MHGIGARIALIGQHRIMMKNIILEQKGHQVVSYVINADRKKKLENVHNQTQVDSVLLCIPCKGGVS